MKKSKWESIPIAHQNWFGWNIEKVFTRFQVQSYLGDTTVKDIGGNVWALFKSNKPDRSKGHKEIVMLALPFGSKGQAYVNGRDKKDIKKYLIVDGIFCNTCQKAYYSSTGHDFHYCQCKKVAVDGGREYLKILGNKEDYQTCSINLLTQKVKIDE